MTKQLYDGQDGKYVETGEVAPKYSRAVKGRPYLCDKGTPRERVVVDNGVGEFYESVPILRLATPEEIAVSRDFANKSDVLASYNIDVPDGEIRGVFEPKPAGIRLSPESVGKAYRTRGGWKAVVRKYTENNGLGGCIVDHHREGGRGWGHKFNGRINLPDDWGVVQGLDANPRDCDLISEWDVDAPKASTPIGSIVMDTKELSQKEAAIPITPAQPAIPADAAGFYQWMWGYPQPFEVGLKPEPVRVPCACCKGSGRAEAALEASNAGLCQVKVFALVTCPECQGSGEQAGR